MSQVPRFLSLLQVRGQLVIYHREEGGTPCPCRKRGYRDPVWHEKFPGAPMCNEEGFLVANIIERSVRAFVQPVQSRGIQRQSSEIPIELFLGEVQADDHVGIFPIEWSGITLNFRDWDMAGADFIAFDGRRYVAVNSNKIPDPADGDVWHHWEVGLRLMTTARVAV